MKGQFIGRLAPYTSKVGNVVHRVVFTVPDSRGVDTIQEPLVMQCPLAAYRALEAVPIGTNFVLDTVPKLYMGKVAGLDLVGVSLAE